MKILVFLAIFLCKNSQATEKWQFFSGEGFYQGTALNWKTSSLKSGFYLITFMNSQTASLATRMAKLVTIFSKEKNLAFSKIAVYQESEPSFLKSLLIKKNLLKSSKKHKDTFYVMDLRKQEAQAQEEEVSPLKIWIWQVDGRKKGKRIFQAYYSKEEEIQTLYEAMEECFLEASS